MNRLFRYKLDHVFFWILTVFFHGFIRTEVLTKLGVGYFMMELVVRNGLLAIVIYSHLVVFIPRYYGRSTYALGAVYTVLSILFYVGLKNTYDMYVYGYVMNDKDQLNYFHNTLYNLSIILFYLTFSVTLYLSKQWYIQQQHIREIELEKLNTELEYLKSQINPHFLFNSINTIFFQIDKQNLIARDTLSRFSDMLRYQLYECNGHEIPIEKEVSYLKNYVELQRLRKDTNYRIEFMGDNVVRNFSIAPLLIIPFVENAFKHVSHFSDQVNQIRINLNQSPSIFQLEVYNTKQGMNQVNGSGGIGLKNAQRRLDLLYPDRHELIIKDGSDFFSVVLKLQITTLS